MLQDKTDEIRECIEALSAKKNGRITPDDVIEEARNPESPLHSHFNWNVEEAALEAWRQRARQIIASVRVDIRTDRTVLNTIAYVRDPSVAAEEQGYISVAVLRDDTDLAARAFIYEFTRAEAALNRASEVAAVLQLEPQVKKLKDRVSQLRKKVQHAEFSV